MQYRTSSKNVRRSGSQLKYTSMTLPSGVATKKRHNVKAMHQVANASGLDQ